MNKHVYIKELQPILRKTITSKDGESYMVKDILDDLAVRHLTSKPGFFTENLVKRMERYLEEQPDWTAMKTLRRVALSAGYEKIEVDDACEAIKNNSRIALKGWNEEVKIYPKTKKTDEIQGAIDIFNSN